ncbi:NAD(P)/FAD-dependent oxidoreductase [Paracoccus sp. MC1862]|uniref:NAD(P)/FAD-dependent oxidoreductase n=1 Tax=Paracoccus sp. MC1862 TaxID=2760307 RepID=UPI001603838F|nr:NAD(P)/FAD-dependent oxidoreductase [Paracoccus sp. MC1862]MBB1499290.1 NAD(P)/FAD-dependent oxidoreductase [Paracoccus sp. MC1862]QQO46049.1 NAD(P)/FAD-dependent oxidoreductase [Paracoccus sp. MC1862]
MKQVDVVILGAGAAGLFCGGSLAGHGLRVVVLDHARAPGEKIRISGGGRCNFTNLATRHDTFLSDVPRFCASALAGFRPEDFVALVNRAGIAWHEKAQGQLFCDGRATQVVRMLVQRMGPAELRLGVAVTGILPGERLRVETSAGPIEAAHVVVATGGKSIPKMGATGIGYDIAAATGHRVVDTRPGLVPLTFARQDLELSAPLAGVAVAARASLPALKAPRRKAISFDDQLLFTHRGLSGPAILQISSYWRAGEELALDLRPQNGIAAALKLARREGGRVQVATVLARMLPERLAAAIVDEAGLEGARLADQPDVRLGALADRVHGWRIRPVGTEGYRTAEVTVGGVDCRDLDARSLRSRHVPGLYFIGEVVDVTGWLGGYNFQWAWASGHAAARAILGAPMAAA